MPGLRRATRRRAAEGRHGGAEQAVGRHHCYFFGVLLPHVAPWSATRAHNKLVLSLPSVSYVAKCVLSRSQFPVWARLPSIAIFRFLGLVIFCYFLLFFVIF